MRPAGTVKGKLYTNSRLQRAMSFARGWRRRLERTPACRCTQGRRRPTAA